MKVDFSFCPCVSYEILYLYLESILKIWLNSIFGMELSSWTHNFS
jgi:hypothetical protein